MKKTICILLLIISLTGYGQISRPMVDDQVCSEMSSSRGHSSDRTAFSITSGYTGFKIDGVARQGLNLDIRVPLSRNTPIGFVANGGVVLYNSASSSSQTPVSAPYYPQPEFYYRSEYREPRFSLNFAMAFLGTDAIYYFSDGKVRPYAAAGVEAITWQMNQGFAATLSPTARLGIEVSPKSSFKGFAEFRYMYGMRNILTPYPSSLSYVSTVAFGVSFAPSI